MLEVDQIVVEEGVEHQLAGEAEEIERARPVFVDEGAHRAPVLAQHDLGFRLGAVGRIEATLPEGLDETLLAGLHGADVDGTHAVPNLRIGIGLEPFGRLHHVRIGVVHDAAFSIRHCGRPPRAD